MAFDKKRSSSRSGPGGKGQRRQGASGGRHGGGPGRHGPHQSQLGLAARVLAVEAVQAVLVNGRALDDAESRAETRIAGAISPRDRAFARVIVASVLRRTGEIDAVIGAFLERPLSAASGNLRSIMRCAAAQVLMLETPAHAAINAAVEQCRQDPAARRFDGLANAVLRRVASEGPSILARQDGTRLNIPDWLWTRWVKHYGEADARRIAAASLREAALDLSVKSDAAGWAARLDGIVLPTGSVRCAAKGRIEALPGFAEGAWWVQDAAAALPAKLFGDVAGLEIADLCAAPGGKTVELAAMGAKVTAVDVSADRLGRVRQNLNRLGLEADVVTADASTWMPAREFDGVIVDVPCTATGTIRRHPDILRLKRPEDLPKLAETQARLLRSALRLVKPGGLVIYCSCSLEPEEGVEQVGRFLAGTTAAVRVPIEAHEIGGEADWVTTRGELRTLPYHLQLAPPELSGLDGFFAARLRRTA